MSVRMHSSGGGGVWGMALLVLLLLCVVAASPLDERNLVGGRRMTNGERMARGLPPNKPVWRRSPAQRKRGGTSATPTAPAAAAPTPPAVVSCPLTGTILVNGTSPSGTSAPVFLDNSSDKPGVTANSTDFGVFSLDPCAGSPLDLQCTNCKSLAPYLGVLSSTGTIVTGEASFLQFVNGTVPNALAGSYGGSPAESAVWYLNATSDELTLQWVNQTGDHVPIYPLYITASTPGVETNYFQLLNNVTGVNFTFVPQV